MKRELQFKSGIFKIKHIVAICAFILAFNNAVPNFVTNAKNSKEKAKTEISTGNSKPVRNINTISETQATNYDRITLKDTNDMYKLFDMSLSIIFAELILEEVPMPQMYDDHGRFSGRKNTIGTGSTYAPIDFSQWDNPSAKWWHLYSNPKTFKNRTATHEQMLQLVIGWGRYRNFTENSETHKFDERKTVLQRMFNLLKGASLRPNEFAALYCAAYNNENNIQKLCPFVKENYNDPIACANKIMTWCKTGAANGGTKDRCEFEALVYLNHNDFCGSMLEMYTCPKRGASCINVNGVVAKTLTKDNYKEFSDNAKAKYKKVIYPDGIGPGDILPKLSKYFKNQLVKTNPSNGKTLQKQYDEAIAVYNKGEYEKALTQFLDIEKQGAYGCDLLNDIAITYYSLKQYDNCIKYCQKILKTTDKDEYAKACYNAGRAYEAKGMYDRAVLNYKQAKTYYETYGVGKEDSSVDYLKIYEKAIKRATEAQQNVQRKASSTKGSR